MSRARHGHVLLQEAMGLGRAHEASEPPLLHPPRPAPGHRGPGPQLLRRSHPPSEPPELLRGRKTMSCDHQQDVQGQERVSGEGPEVPPDVHRPGASRAPPPPVAEDGGPSALHSPTSPQPALQPHGRCRRGVEASRWPHSLRKPPGPALDGRDAGDQARPLWGAERKSQAEEAPRAGRAAQTPTRARQVQRVNLAPSPSRSASTSKPMR